MTYPTNDPSIHWWQSRTIWSALIAAISGLAAVTGHNIDGGDQAALVSALTDIANGVAVIFSLASVYYRTQASSTIKPQIIPPMLGGKPETPPAH
jgi:hypothetical protein